MWRQEVVMGQSGIEKFTEVSSVRRTFVFTPYHAPYSVLPGAAPMHLCIVQESHSFS